MTEKKLVFHIIRTHSILNPIILLHYTGIICNLEVIIRFVVSLNKIYHIF